MNYEAFCAECRKLGITDLIRETTEYKDLPQLQQLYAVKNNQLVGCYSGDIHGGKIFKKPMKQWSSSKRKFIKVAI